MKSRLLREIAGAVIIGALTSSAYAITNGTQAGAFLMIANGARPTAMGEAFTGVADDLTAVSWNPAGLAALSSMQTMLSYAAWFADTGFSTVSVGGPIFPGHVIAGTFYAFHVPRIANVPEEIEAPVDLSEYAVGANYAWAMTDRVSIGAGARILSTDIRQQGSPSSAASGALLDLGFLYRSDNPPISGGFVLQNMGPSLKFRDAEAPTPFWARLGFGWRAYRDEWLNLTGAFDTSFPVDTRYHMQWPDGGIAEFYKTSIKGPSQNRFNFGFGAECWFADVLALRGGYTVRMGSDISSPSAGAGLRFTVQPFVYTVDYSYSFWGALSSNVSRVSFAMRLLPGPAAPAE